MLTKMVLKILLKATVPLVCVIGITSYGMYARGGDPGALFSKLLGHSIQSAKTSVQGAGDSLQSVSPIKTAKSKTKVYKWVDEYGVTQFGSAPPEGVQSTSKTYNNNANLIAAQKPVRAQHEFDQPAAALGPDGQPLPGVAGMNLPVAVDPAVLNEFLQTMQQPRE